MRIFFAWELGGHLGHFARLLPVARRLRAEGHDVIFATPDPRSAAQVLTRERFPHVAAPRLRRKTSTPAPVNFGDLLLQQGYGDFAGLLGLTQGWVGLLNLARTDVLVADYAPTALLAVRVARIPAVTLANGFQVPPRGNPTPPLRPADGVPEERLEKADHAALGGINRLLSRERRETLESVSDLFAAGPVLLATYPELDPWGPRYDVEYVGNLGDLGVTRDIDWPIGARPRILAYLSPEMERLSEVLDAISATAASALTVLPGASAQWCASRSNEKVKVISEPVQMERLIASADLVVAHGGAGLTAQALIAGIPLALLPLQAEQALTANRVEAIGAGRTARQPYSAADLRAAFLDVLRGASYWEAAEAFAARYAGWSREAAIARVVSLVKAAPLRCAGPVVAMGAQ
ncbi:MAG: glycosyltransferase [Pseudomonadota bacterium]